MGVLIFCTIFPKYFSFYEELSDILIQIYIYIYIYLHVQFRFLFDFNKNRIFLIFLKNNQTLSFMIIHLVEAQLFHEDRQTQRRTEDSWTGRETDRQTDMTKIIVVLRSNANAPKILSLHYKFWVMYAKIKICRICYIFYFHNDLCLSLTYVRNVYRLFQIQLPIFVVKSG